MSDRRRTIAGAPMRSAAEAAALVVEMVSETLEPAFEQNPASELADVEGALRMLISGKHLTDDAPLVLLADPLRLEIRLAYGNEAMSLAENLGKVPGAATATDWALHVPTPAPIGTWIEQAVAGSEHVTVQPAPKAVAAAASASVEIDAAALRRAAGEA